MEEIKANELRYMSGAVEVHLTPETVKKSLVRGQGNVSDQEVMMFMGLCRANKLNPFASDAYLIKYGDYPAAPIVSINALMKRADSFESYDGFSAGVIVQNPETGKMNKRVGSAVYDGEKLLAGWAEVYRNDRTHTYETVVDYADAVTLAKNGAPNAQWQKRPGMMIRKTALARALREAFPNDFGNTYSDEEEAKDTYAVDIGPAEVVQKEDPFKKIEENAQKEKLPVPDEHKAEELKADEDPDEMPFA